MEAIEQAIINNDSAGVKSNAHAIKGVAGTLAAQRIHAAAEKMEITASKESSLLYPDLFLILNKHYGDFLHQLEQEGLSSTP